MMLTVYKPLKELIKQFISLKGDRILLLDEKSKKAWEKMVDAFRDFDVAVGPPLPISRAKSARK